MVAETVFVNDLFDEEITIDNEAFPWVHGISIKAKLNTARTVTIQFSTREGLEMCSVGRTIRIRTGKSDVAGGIDFVGKIKTVIPGFDVSTATAFDYIADLNSSELFNVKDNNFAGMDLLQAAKSGLNNSEDDNLYQVDADAQIDIGSLNTACGVLYKPDQGFEGYQTRKSFLDKIFAETYTLKPSSIYFGGAYPPLTYLRWFYAIRNNNVLETFQPDIYTNAPVAKVGPNSFSIIGKGLNATIDTTRMINSVAVVSDNTDYVAKYTDESSVHQYGSQSSLVSVKSSDPSRMDELAHGIVSTNNRPAGAYTIMLENGHWIDVGNTIEVTIPSLGERKRFIVKEYTTTIKETISTALTLGTGRITTSELVKRIAST